MEKTAKKINSPFAGSHRGTAKQEFDTKYEKISIVNAVKKTGTGENDYVVYKKVIREYTPIKEVVSADAESCGVQNIIKQVLLTKDTSILPVDKGVNADLLNAPENLMELKQRGIDAQQKFESLPQELVNGQSMTSFVENMSQERFNEFAKALADRLAKKDKKEVKENE